MLRAAQACGVPVIATWHSDIPEAVRHGETGWLVEEKSPEQIAERVAWFRDHPAALADFGCCARGYVERRHNAEIETEKLEMIYDELIAGDAR